MILMAKLTRLLFGGVVGAGLAYLVSRKDVRRRLMGAGQVQLMAPEAPRADMPTATAPAPVTTPVEEPEPVDLESRIIETRRQVEEQLESPFTASTAVSKEEAEAVVEEAVELEAEAVELEAEAGEEPDIAEVIVSEEEIDTGEAPETILEEEETVEEEETFESVTEVSSGPEIEAIIGQETEVTSEPEAEAAPELETDEFADLRMPAAGEPSTASPEIDKAAPGTEGGPAPSQIDREEMRRRIDETRARLKAKAFDALVSGETFIEPCLLYTSDAADDLT